MPKNVKGGPFGIFWTSIVLQNIKKLMGGPFGAIEKIPEKNGKVEVSQCRKKGESLIVSKKVERGIFCFGMAFYLMLEALDALKMKY